MTILAVFCICFPLFLTSCADTLGNKWKESSHYPSPNAGANADIKFLLEDPATSDAAPHAEGKEIYDQKRGGDATLDQSIGAVGTWRF